MRPMLLLLWLGTSGCLLGWDPAEDTAGLVDTTPIDTDNTVGFCGDGINVPPEECDDGEANNVGGYGFCNPDCTLGPYCGDGTPDSVEECDLGTKQNTGDYGTCNPDCTLTRFCLSLIHI